LFVKSGHEAKSKLTTIWWILGLSGLDPALTLSITILKIEVKRITFYNVKNEKVR
jgi:hypothetical protein